MWNMTQKWHCHDQDHSQDTFCRLWEPKYQMLVTRQVIHQCQRWSNRTKSLELNSDKKGRRHQAEGPERDNSKESEIRRVHRKADVRSFQGS